MNLFDNFADSLLQRNPISTCVEYHNIGNFIDTKRTLQEFSDCGLHNGKYTKNQPIENCGLRDDHIKGTSHRKVKCDLLQVVCRHN